MEEDCIELRKLLSSNELTVAGQQGSFASLSTWAKVSYGHLAELDLAVIEGEVAQRDRLSRLQRDEVVSIGVS